MTNFINELFHYIIYTVLVGVEHLFIYYLILQLSLARGSRERE